MRRIKISFRRRPVDVPRLAHARAMLLRGRPPRSGAILPCTGSHERRPAPGAARHVIAEQRRGGTVMADTHFVHEETQDRLEKPLQRDLVGLSGLRVQPVGEAHEACKRRAAVPFPEQQGKGAGEAPEFPTISQ